MPLGKTLIIGDSYSTFEGAIPEGYHTWYLKGKHDNTDVAKVEQTWWYQVFDGKDNILVLNDSFSGTTVCNSVRPEHKVEWSYINRFDKLVNDGFFTENQIDTVIVFGATNDSYTDAPIGENQFENFTEEDLLKTLPACGYLAKRISEAAPKARVCWIINSELKEKITNGIIKNAKHFGQEYILFTELDKLSGHPSVKGMKQIAEAVISHFGE